MGSNAETAEFVERVEFYYHRPGFPADNATILFYSPIEQTLKGDSGVNLKWFYLSLGAYWLFENGYTPEVISQFLDNAVATTRRTVKTTIPAIAGVSLKNPVENKDLSFLAQSVDHALEDISRSGEVLAMIAGDKLARLSYMPEFESLDLGSEGISRILSLGVDALLNQAQS